MCDALKRRAKGNRLSFATVLTAAAFDVVFSQAVIANRQGMLPGGNLALKKDFFWAGLRAGVAECAFTVGKVNFGVAALTAF
ncbi:hypothetical protein BSPA111_11150 [Buttiauxella sp. A111]|nr:hypothetical protein BSPA111_11150 [Buttiauxella sp. A111]